MAGITYIVNEALIAGTMPISIDFTPMGYRVSGQLQSPDYAGHGCV